MKLSEIWIIALIVLVSIIGVAVAVKLLPLYVSIMIALGYILGGICGWWLKGLYDKYFPQK